MKIHMHNLYLGIVFITILSLSLSSCMQTSVTRLSTEYNYRSVSAQEVKIYLEPEDVPCSFERIALINTKSNFEIDNTRSINAAKKKAAAEGGNGLIIREYQYPEGEEGISKIGTMVAIHVSENNCRK